MTRRGVFMVARRLPADDADDTDGQTIHLSHPRCLRAIHPAQNQTRLAHAGVWTWDSLDLGFCPPPDLNQR